MKLNIKILIFTIGVTTLIACNRNKSIDLCNYIDSKYNIQMNINHKENYLISPKSDKQIKLLKWAKSNVVGWEKTPPISYYSQIYLKQDDFILLYSKGFNCVIINIRIDGNYKQYKKTIPKGELDFLFNQ